MPWETVFIENATRARKAAGVSQTELARRLAAQGLPFHQQTVQRIEQGQRPVRLNEVIVMADVLGMGDLQAIIEPETVEKAAEFLSMALVRFADELGGTHRLVKRHVMAMSAAAFQLLLARDRYSELAGRVGKPVEPFIIGEADRLYGVWQSIESHLQQVREESAAYDHSSTASGQLRAAGYALQARKDADGVDSKET